MLNSDVKKFGLSEEQMRRNYFSMYKNNRWFSRAMSGNNCANFAIFAFPLVLLQSLIKLDVAEKH